MSIGANWTFNSEMTRSCWAWHRWTCKTTPSSWQSCVTKLDKKISRKSKIMTPINTQKFHLWILNFKNNILINATFCLASKITSAELFYCQLCSHFFCLIDMRHHLSVEVLRKSRIVSTQALCCALHVVFGAKKNDKHEPAEEWEESWKLNVCADIIIVENVT